MDMLLEILTNPKPILKRAGHTEPFQFEKLERSLNSALQSVGKNEDAVRALVEDVLHAFGPMYLQETAPSTSHLREAIFLALDKHELSNLKERYKKDSVPASATPTPSSSAPVSSTLATSMPTPSSESFKSPVSPVAPVSGETYVARRRRLNEERKAVTHKFQVGGYEGYLTVGLYDDGQPGEIFLRMNKEGSMLSGLMDSFATAISIGLQYGVPLKVLVKKFANVHFEPNGPTQNPNIPHARSIMDYVFRWLALKFLTPEERQAVLGLHVDEPSADNRDLSNVDGARQSRLLDGASV